MTLDELKEEVNNALKVNDERLDTEALKNQELYAKYQTINHDLNYSYIKQRVITKNYIVRNGNTMVVRLMQKSMSQNHLTLKY